MSILPLSRASLERKEKAVLSFRDGSGGLPRPSLYVSGMELESRRSKVEPSSHNKVKSIGGGGGENRALGIGSELRVSK